MSLIYLDTSAAAKLLVQEVESDALAAEMERDHDVVACHLLETELRRFAARSGVAQAEVTSLLDGVDMYDVPASLFRQAGLMPGATLRSLDALHLSAALNLGVDYVATYDTRMSAAAVDAGLHVLAPGA